MSNKYDKIRPFYDSEVNAAVQSISSDPIMKAIMQFAFSEKTAIEQSEILESTHSIQDFQSKIVYQALQKILAQSSDGLTSSGFDKLDKNTAYLFISNHRDILLDTCLLNVTLLEKGLNMTASAIGDNLVRVPTLHTLAKINRNFLVLRGLSPRELLMSSKLMSDYIRELLTVENRSVWIAQREGRTKDGNDATHTGVLKMLTMAAGKTDMVEFWRQMKIVPVSISYQYDPTDSLKIPELLANKNNEIYEKHESEDFNSILKGLMGRKKKIHIHAGDVLASRLAALETETNANQQIKILAQLIDNQIVGNYKLWSSNYIAYDLLNETETYKTHYSAGEKQSFETRMNEKINCQDCNMRQLFLEMYANPVVNKMGLA